NAQHDTYTRTFDPRPRARRPYLADRGAGAAGGLPQHRLRRHRRPLRPVADATDRRSLASWPAGRAPLAFPSPPRHLPPPPPPDPPPPPLAAAAPIQVGRSTPASRPSTPPGSWSMSRTSPARALVCGG